MKTARKSCAAGTEALIGQPGLATAEIRQCETNTLHATAIRAGTAFANRFKAAAVMPVVASPITTPSSLRAEDEELHAELEAAGRLRGRLEQAAKTVAEALHPHFAQEESYAIRAPGALPALEAGKIPRNVEEVRTLAQQLESELEHLLHSQGHRL